MSPSFGKKKPTLIDIGEVRKSKLVHTAGIGAIVDFPGFSGIMAGQNLWSISGTDEMKVHEIALEQLLGREFFLQIVAEKENNNYKKPYKIPAIRFPQIYYCPYCGQLDRAKYIASNYNKASQKTDGLKCNHCEKTLVPSRFVIACENGHIDEFPYKFWAHKNSNHRCERPRLKMVQSNKTGGLESLFIECETCGAKNSMANCMSESALTGWSCKGTAPWLGREYTTECGKNLRVIMRGANNVYYPETVSALTIPPWSSRIQKTINESFSGLKMIIENSPNQETADILIRGFFNNKYKNILRCSEEEFLTQVYKRFRNQDSILSEKDIVENEYKAFTGEDIDDIYFKTEEVERSTVVAEYFSKVKKVRRLREVVVLRGFRRVQLSEESFMAPLSDKREKWLPAVEMLGEGIFIEVSADKVTDWVQKQATRYLRLKERYEQKKLYLRYRAFSPEYVLLHTISHLLMRKMAFVSGYEVSSLKEKVYVNTEKKRYGLLIYTATSSSDGSLGGLVRIAEKLQLEDILLSMLEDALWCSNDPICSGSHGQGNHSLNYAACYACTLVPEICCELDNSLLDRVAVIGSEEDRSKGFFGSIIEKEFE